MKTGRRKLLRGLTYVIAGVAAVSMIKSLPVRAVGVNVALLEYNVGAARYLDALDRGGDGIDISPDESAGDSDSEGDSRMSNLVMANVQNSLNVREEASEESAKVGYMYADCGGTILEKNGDWTKIKSGNLVGWCHNDYLLFGAEAQELAEKVGITTATVTADALRVRKEPNNDAGIWGLVAKGDCIEAITEDTTDSWVAIDFEGDEGYISAEYVDIEFRVDTGESIEEIKERERKEKEREQEEKRKRATQIANLGAVAVGTTDEALLGSLVYWEAGNQGYDGMLAVASVVMNRVRSAAYPNTVAGVIYASGQFTPALNGKVELQLQIGVPAACLQAAKEAIAGKTNVGTATHFRRYTGQDGIVIGAHVFY